MQHLTLLFLFSILSTVTLFAQKPPPQERAVQISASTQLNPPQIQLNWKADPTATKYLVFKKSLTATTWGDTLAELSGTATTFLDTNVVVGTGYEYALFKEDFLPRIDTVEVAVGTEVKFVVTDMFGIGLCCSFGHGFYEVTNDSVLVATGDDFGGSESTVFTVTDSLVYIKLLPDMFENSTSWVLENNQTGAQLATSGPVGAFIKPRSEYGFIYAGIQLPAIEQRGSILLLVDSTYADGLENEIQELEMDFRKDSWRVLTELVNPSDSVTQVKALIQNKYNQQADLAAVFLLGHIPIPFSGDIFPDTHFELRGAYPADVYYGEMNGDWTDTLVNNTTANFNLYHNIPNDGKFDQSAIPSSKAELQVGRVDFFDLPAFNIAEVELLRQYLNKNHAFKNKHFNPIRRGLIDDNFNEGFAAPAATGYRNFATMFGADSIFQLDYFSTLRNESYLWSYGCGGGSSVSVAGVGSTSDFTNDSLQTIFTMLFGSQFGNWAYSNNILRAPLAAGQTLTNAWAGNPPWTLHHMSMGYPIGYSLLKTQNESENLYLGNGPQLVHVALMGDPSLRMYYVAPPTDLELTELNNGIQINWQKPTNENVDSFYIYRTDSLEHHFTKIATATASDTTFTDFFPSDSTNFYMVKTLKLEHTGSGSFFNLSLGVLDSINFSGTDSLECLPDTTFAAVPIPSAVYGIYPSVLAFGEVRKDSTVVFLAKDSIVLTDGFVAEAGSNFRASLTECNSPNNYELENTDESEEDIFVFEKIKLDSEAEKNQEIAMPASLEQNAPNPFYNETIIKYYLPKNFESAMIRFTNWQGQHLKTIPLQHAGAGTISISSKELTAGMYAYTLVMDGRIVDAKKMILTR